MCTFFTNINSFHSFILLSLVDCDLVKMCLQCPALVYNLFSGREDYSSEQTNSSFSQSSNQNESNEQSSSSSSSVIVNTNTDTITNTTTATTTDNPLTGSSRFDFVVQKLASCRDMRVELILICSIWNNNRSGDDYVG